MAEIKSALEIALERTASVEVDKEALEADRARREGMTMVSKFLDDPKTDLKEMLKSKTGKEKEWAREGMVQVLLANLVLPQDQLAIKKLKSIGGAFMDLKSDRRISQMFDQLSSFFTEYVEEKDRLQELVTQQHGPRLQQKEQELAQRMGQNVRIDHMTDPEFVAALRKAQAQLDDRYIEVLDKVKGELAAWP